MKRLLALLLACLIALSSLLLAQEGGDEPTTDDLSWAAYIVEAVHGGLETSLVYWFPEGDLGDWNDLFPSLPGLPPGMGGGSGPGNRPPPTEEEEEEKCLELIKEVIAIENSISYQNEWLQNILENGLFVWRNDERIRLFPGDPTWNAIVKDSFELKQRERKELGEIEDEVEDCFN